ncbi:hypothetical protein M153_23229000586, partial [Pseudoloma neurophilia]
DEILGLQTASVHQKSSQLILIPFEQTHSYFHIMNGHPGIRRTIATLSQSTNLNAERRRIIEKSIKTCPFCQLNKKNSIQYCLLSGHVVKEDPLKHVAADIYGLFLLDEYEHDLDSDKCFVVSFIDRATHILKMSF